MTAPRYPSAPPTSRDQLPEEGPDSVPPLRTRAAARLFDGLLLLIPWLLLTVPYMDFDDPEAFLDGMPAWAGILLVVIPVTYEFGFLATVGATPGKLLLGTRVRRYVDGGRIAPYQAGLRALIPALGGVFGLLVREGGVAEVLSLVEPFVYLSSLLDPLLRGLHDRAAGTVVLRAG